MQLFTKCTRLCGMCVAFFCARARVVLSAWRVRCPACVCCFVRRMRWSSSTVDVVHSAHSLYSFEAVCYANGLGDPFSHPHTHTREHGTEPRTECGSIITANHDTSASCTCRFVLFTADVCNGRATDARRPMTVPIDFLGFSL